MNSDTKHIAASASRALLRKPALLIGLLILTACALVASTYRYFSVTWDEPEHLAAGMQLLDRDVYIYDVQHPPIARLAMALGPYLAGARAFDEPGPSGEQAGRDLFYKTGHYELYLTLARLGMLPFLAILLWSTWAWARRQFGVGTAALATVLLIATPPIMGHAGFAALDIPGAATCTLAFYCLLRWYETATWKFALATGIASGLAIASKLSGLPFIALVGLSWLPFWWRSRMQAASITAPTTATRWLGQVGAILFVALLCVVFSYSFEFRYTVTDQYPYNTAWSYLFGRTGTAHNIAHAIAHAIPLPTGMERFVWSLEALIKHNDEGHLSYLLGEFNKNGFREFYVVALAVKTPITLLLLGIAGLILLAIKARRENNWTIAAPTIAFVVLLAFCSFYSHINIGLRHVFVLYPLLCIAAAAFTVTLWQRASHFVEQRVVRAALVLLIGWQVSLLYSAYPDYLPYFNFTAGDHPEHILIDSDLDWGQDIERLQKRLMELKVTKFGFVYRGTIDVIGERLPGVWMAQPFQPATGWVAASIYARDTVSQGEAFKWLQQYTPRERIGKSIDLYYIPEPAN
ncbi:MAG: phospholipid carrier-dependent glycosyltransferase [Steroidobacteraceae bacterium]